MIKNISKKESFLKILNKIDNILKTIKPMIFIICCALAIISALISPDLFVSNINYIIAILLFLSIFDTILKILIICLEKNKP